MTTIYLVRHAEAAGNQDRRFQGHFDGAISANGLRQLEYLEQRFAKMHLDAVYSSPLRRAYWTAEAVNRAANLPIHVRKDLMEINGGGFEGVPFADLPLRFPEAFDNWNNNPAAFVAPGHGESMPQVYERMRRALDEIVKKHPGQAVAVVSHGCAIRNYVCYAMGWPVERVTETPWCDNTAVSEIHYDEDRAPHALYTNDISHLPQELSTLLKQDWWKKTPGKVQV